MLRTAYLTVIISLLICNFSHAQYKEERIQIEIIDNNIFVKVLINEKGPYNFIFDTGASGIGRIDERIVKELDLKTTDSTKNYDGSGMFKMIPNIGINKIKLGDIELKNVQLPSRNYNVNSKKDAVLIDGVIGRDFFSNYLLAIDFPNKYMYYSYDALDKNSAGVISYIEPFEIIGKINGVENTFHIDTGSNMDMHFPKAVIDNLNHTDTGKKGIARKANSEYFIRETILDENIEISLINVKNQTVHYSEKASYINVGTKFLKKYKVIIDQKNKLFKME